MGVDPWVDRGTCPPTFWSGGGALCVVPSPTFSGVDIFCTNAQLHSTDYIKHTSQFSFASCYCIPTYLLLDPVFIKFIQLILRKIIKIDVAIRCQILRPKCTKLYFGWGAPPELLAGFKGPTSKERGEEKAWGGRGRSPLLFCGFTPMQPMTHVG